MHQPNKYFIFVMHNHVKVSKLMIYMMINLIYLQCNDTGLTSINRAHLPKHVFILIECNSCFSN